MPTGVLHRVAAVGCYWVSSGSKSQLTVEAWDSSSSTRIADAIQAAAVQVSGFASSENMTKKEKTAVFGALDGVVETLRSRGYEDIVVFEKTYTRSDTGHVAPRGRGRRQKDPTTLSVGVKEEIHRACEHNKVKVVEVAAVPTNSKDRSRKNNAGASRPFLSNLNATFDLVFPRLPRDSKMALYVAQQLAHDRAKVVAAIKRIVKSWGKRQQVPVEAQEVKSEIERLVSGL